jgi:phosphate transport system protein
VAMLRVAYHEALESAEQNLALLGALLTDALHHAIRALESADTALAARIITGADQTVDISRQVESTCIELIWKQQPIAGELRVVLAMFEINRDLQRVDHYIVDVAKHTVRLAGRPPNATWIALKDMANLVESDVTRAIQGYRTRKPELADEVLADEERQEKVYVSGIEALQAAIRADAAVVEAATEMIFVLTALERIGEHALNIAWHAKEMIEA